MYIFFHSVPSPSRFLATLPEGQGSHSLTGWYYFSAHTHVTELRGFSNCSLRKFLRKGPCHDKSAIFISSWGVMEWKLDCNRSLNYNPLINWGLIPDPPHAAQALFTCSCGSDTPPSRGKQSLSKIPTAHQSRAAPAADSAKETNRQKQEEKIQFSPYCKGVVIRAQ